MFRDLQAGAPDVRKSVEVPAIGFDKVAGAVGVCLVAIMCHWKPVKVLANNSQRNFKLAQEFVCPAARCDDKLCSFVPSLVGLHLHFVVSGTPLKDRFVALVLCSQTNCLLNVATDAFFNQQVAGVRFKQGSGVFWRSETGKSIEGLRER